MEYRNQIVNMDALSYLRTLPDGSVNCIVTSPPYYALRDYGVEGQLGLEPTPAEYVANMVAVFREAKRALRDDGVCFVNLGDSYSSGGRNTSSAHTNTGGASPGNGLRRPPVGIAPEKSLLGIPWRFALAMMDDGWILRNDIIWAKRNPMPESVTDRFTSSHEHVFMFTKRPRYWADMYAVREPNTSPEQHAHNQKYAKEYAAFDNRATATGQPGNVNNVGIHARPGAEGRNARDVWSLSSEPFAGAHFAVMPSKLVEKCLLVACPETVCSVCGAPWTRVVERTAMVIKRSDWAEGSGNRTASSGTMLEPPTAVDHGFRPPCSCDQGTARGVVCDPFMGSGTVARTAIKLRRDFCGCDLNPVYVDMSTDSLDGLQVTLFTL